MANKQINELTELTTASGTDLLVVYDNNEAGSEKTKKITVDNLVGGAWVLTDSEIFSNEGKTGYVYYSNPSSPMEIIIALDVTATFDFYFSWGGNGDVENYISDSDTGHPRKMLAGAGAGKLYARVSIDPTIQIAQLSLTHSNGSVITSSLISQQYLSSLPDYFRIQIYDSGNINCTGYMNLYEKI